MKPKLPKLSGKYGAPMGRHSFGTLENVKPRSLYVRKIYLNSGGYDSGGAYWGARPRGASLYWLTDGGGYSQFVDASCRERALIEAGAGEYPDVLACRRLVGELRDYAMDTLPDQWGHPARAPRWEGWTETEARDIMAACGVKMGRAAA